MQLRRVLSVIALALTIPALLLSAQEVSEKKELALFKLGHSAWNLPEEVLAGVDEQIKNVFINLRRFDIIGMDQRLESGDVNVFVDQIKAYKERATELTEEVQMGKEFFTEADFNRLVGSFIVVIPSVTNFITKQDKGGTYTASLQTSFSFVNVEEGKTFAHSVVETSGSDKDLQTAVQDALGGIPLQLTYEVRSVPEFQLKTGIVEVNGRKIVLVLGQDMGLKKGDEYAIISSRIISSGKNLTTEKGLVYIEEVGDEASVGRLIYAQGGASPGEELREIPRLGFEGTLYGRLLSDINSGRTVGMAGLRVSPIRGFGSGRPFFLLEVPGIRNILWGIPFNVGGGFEYAMYLGKVQVTPSASLAFGGAYLWLLDDEDTATEDAFLPTHFGGGANLSISYLFTRNFRLTVDAGGLYYFSLNPVSDFSDSSLLFQSYGGPYIGVGASIRF